MGTQGTVATPPPTINLRDTRERVADLIEPNPAVYWADLVLSAAAGWTAFGVALGRPLWSPAHLVLCALAALALYRSAMFIHELTHLPKGALPGFQWTWDLLVGIPLQLPSFMYLGVHLDHHRKTIYGTPADPEYQPFATSPRRRIVRYLLEAPAIPILLLARFALLAPLSLLLGPRFRNMVVEGASSLAINWSYRRDPPNAALRGRWLICETLAAVVGVGVVALTIAGVLAPRVLGQWYLVSVSVAVLNQLRTIGAHRWRNAGGEMDVVSQLFDSVNTPGPLGALWAPVGLRFHALHHFVPDLPYHALGKAHRRLTRALPAEAGYQRTVSRGMFDSLATVWREAGGAEDRRL
jgi:fatty acid desaturase